MRDAAGMRLALLLVALLALPGTAQAALVLPGGFQERTLVAGLDGPVGAAYAPDGRLFVAEKTGRVRVVSPTGELQDAPLIDLSAETNSYWDRGLLGIAVDTDFAANRFLYLLHTVEDDAAQRTGPKTSRLIRVQVSPLGVVSGRRTLLGTITGPGCPGPPSDAMDCLPSEGSSHSIGSVRSAPDGTLWVGSGDGASFTFADRLALRAYDPRSFAGKLIHVDRDGRGLAGHPYCPGEADLTKVCTKVAAVGFRNPFRFVLRGGLPVVGDVGWASREELDVVAPGRNYGWPCYEGNARPAGYREFPECVELYAGRGPIQQPVTPPAYAYDHAGGSASVQAGPQYGGSAWPAAYGGRWFFGDYSTGDVKSYALSPGGRITDVQSFATGYGGTELLTHPPTGDLVYVDYFDGKIKRISYTSAPVAVATADRLSGVAPLAVRFSAAGSSDPDGDPLRYRWEFGDGATSTQADPTHTYAAGTYTARLTVDDGRGRSDSATLRISAGNTAPSLTITTPADGSRYSSRELIRLSATATDAQDGPLPGTSVRWAVKLNHLQHFHPVDALTGTSASFRANEDHDADSFYVVTATATDSGGLDTSRTIRLDPERVRLTIGSRPEGALLTYAGGEFAQTRVADAAVGFVTEVGAEPQFVRDGRTFVFDRWSDGGARSHRVTIPATDTTLVAVYREVAGPVVSGGAAGPGPAPSPVGPAPAPAPGPGAPAPNGPLRLSLDPPFRGAVRAVRQVTGRLIGSGQAPRVLVAVSRPWRGSRRLCAWWSPARRGFGPPARCARPASFSATVERSGAGWRWTARLGGRLRRGSYRVVLRVVGTDGRTLARLTRTT